MTGPYEAVRAAVGTYAAGGTRRTAAAGAAGTPAGGVFTPRVPAVAEWDGTRHVARYPGAGFARSLLRLAVRCSRAVPVHVYVGGLDDNSRESSYGDGSLADFDPNMPPYIPQNTPVFIVWDTVNAADTASCTATFVQV